MSFPMPEVETQFPPEKLEAVFERARKASRGEIEPAPGKGKGERCVAAITPGRLVAMMSIPAPNSMARENVQAIERILPAQPSRNVVALAFYGIEAVQSIQNAVKAIPFYGFLSGFAYIGHCVIVFEGHPSVLEIGLKGADLLLADARVIPALQKDWLDVAYRVMRTPMVNLYQPNGQVQQIIRQKPTS